MEDQKLPRREREKLRQRQEMLASALDLFSEDDCAVHRTVFPGAHTVAVVANDVSAADVTFSAYGWSLGMLQRRALHVCKGLPA
jgi:hypothetical protein